MQPSDQARKQALRLSGRLKQPEAKVPTYQELLDDALDQTFPASDPLAIGAGAHTADPHPTRRDATDWTLTPGSDEPVDPHPASPIPLELGAMILRQPLSHRRSNGAMAHVPAGPCMLKQRTDHAVLSWKEGRSHRRVKLSLETLQTLVATRQLEALDTPR